MPPGCHVALAWLAHVNVHDIIEQIGFAVLASKVSADNVLMIGEVRFARLAAVDLAAVEVRVVGKAHLLRVPD